jgi:hypothetical protein
MIVREPDAGGQATVEGKNGAAHFELSGSHGLAKVYIQLDGYVTKKRPPFEVLDRSITIARSERLERRVEPVALEPPRAIPPTAIAILNPDAVVRLKFKNSGHRRLKVWLFSQSKELWTSVLVPRQKTSVLELEGQSETQFFAVIERDDGARTYLGWFDLGQFARDLDDPTIQIDDQDGWEIHPPLDSDDQSI